MEATTTNQAATGGTQPVDAQLVSILGAGITWQADGGQATMVWPLDSFEVVWAGGNIRDAGLRTLWRARQARGAKPVVILSPSRNPGEVRVLGPQDPQAPVRNLPSRAVVRLLEEAKSRPRREAAATLAAEFARLDESGIPGVGIKDLLTPYFAKVRLKQPENWERLERATEKLGAPSSWRDLFAALGYRIEETPSGHLLRVGEEPVAVLHAYPDTSLFSRATEQGSLPEGLILADCEHHGAHWGVLATSRRFRLFRHDPPVGAATGQYLEIDLLELAQEDRPYVGLLSPDALRAGGWLSEWADDARLYGEELHVGLEERVRLIALPKMAQGIGAYFETEQQADLSDHEVLRGVEEAALTLLFRFMFILHAEARGFLPVESDSYRSDSAVELAWAARRDLQRLDRRSTRLWDGLTKLFHMMRTGNRSVGVSAYNGSLFAADGFPGARALEDVRITDDFLAPALVAVAFEDETPDAAGLDYAGLQIGHLGAIYEGLLALRLTRAPDDLVYDKKKDFFRPAQAGETAEVRRAQLHYQSETGGRKAGGVFYTRHEFVRHLLEHSLAPALDAHLGHVKEVARTNTQKAADLLFDFSVVDPAMGSAHFLTAALDVMADRIQQFLVDIGGLPSIGDLLDSLKSGEDGTEHIYQDGDLLRRLILKRCIYGVDLSPMAVEVANISLWLASFVPGLALSYLGSNLKVGDSLMGAADLSALSGLGPLFSIDNPNSEVSKALQSADAAAEELRAAGDRTPEEVARSKEIEERLNGALQSLVQYFDLWSAGALGGDFRSLLKRAAGSLDPFAEVARLHAEAGEEARRYPFFHWPLAFPHIFRRNPPGFDVVVGNPPWDEVNVEELGFYALRDPGLRGLTRLADREARIRKLDEADPALKPEFERRYEELVTKRRFFGTAGGYVQQGKGNLDLFELFCERYGHLTRDGGWLGVVLPRSAFLAHGARGFRRWLFRQCTVGRVDFLLNAGRWAFDMEPRYTVALLMAQRQPADSDAILFESGPSPNLDSFLAASRSEGVAVRFAELRDWTRPLADDPVQEPSWEVPLLPSQAAADLFAKLRRGLRVDQGYPGVWTAFATQGDLNETTDKRFFRHKSGIPVWKGRSFDQYDPHGKDPAGHASLRELEPHLQTKRQNVRSQFRKRFGAAWLIDKRTLPLHNARITFRDVTRATDSRTVRACLVPPEVGLTNKAPYLSFPSGGATAQAFLLGVFNSLPFDWQARRLVEISLNFFILYMLCFPPAETTPWERIGGLAARLSCVDDRFADFAREAGVECGPLGQEDAVGLRAEIDALVSHAYGLDEADLHTIFDDFTENAVSTPYRERVVGEFRKISGG